MSLCIEQFQLAKQRTIMRLGESLQVQLEAVWNPPSQGGSEEVLLSCQPPGYTVSPARITVTVPPGGEYVQLTFRVQIDATASGLVEVFAEASESKSMDSIGMRVER